MELEAQEIREAIEQCFLVEQIHLVEGWHILKYNGNLKFKFTNAAWHHETVSMRDMRTILKSNENALYFVMDELGIDRKDRKKSRQDFYAIQKRKNEYYWSLVAKVFFYAKLSQYKEFSQFLKEYEHSSSYMISRYRKRYVDYNREHEFVRKLDVAINKVIKEKI